MRKKTYYLYYRRAQDRCGLVSSSNAFSEITVILLSFSACCVVCLPFEAAIRIHRHRRGLFYKQHRVSAPLQHACVYIRIGRYVHILNRVQKSIHQNRRWKNRGLGNVKINNSEDIESGQLSKTI